MPGETPTEPVRRRGGLGAETGMLGAMEERSFIATAHTPGAPAQGEEGPPRRRAENIDPEKADQIAMEALGEGEDKPAPAPEAAEKTPEVAEKTPEAQPPAEEAKAEDAKQAQAGEDAAAAGDPQDEGEKA